MAKRNFHHGNLRAELLELAESELELHGYEALSLRDLAVSLGVSRAAPYRHFESKNALLLALAENGVEQLGQRYQSARDLAGGPSERLRAACQAYLDFAEERPQLFRLIFVSDADWEAALPADVEATSAFGIFEQLVSENLGVLDAEEKRNAAVVCWCVIHGFAMLRMNGRVKNLSDVEAVEQAILAVACRDAA